MPGTPGCSSSRCNRVRTVFLPPHKTCCFSKGRMFVFRPCTPLLALGASLALWTVPSLEAQSTQAALVGTVTDPSGAVIPNASVLVTNTDTAQAVTVKSDAAGLYQVQDLVPGPYTVRVDAEGFKAVAIQKLTLAARQQLRADAQLETGSVEQQVSVDAASAGDIETETASVSGSISAAEVKQLPANYRASPSGTSPITLIQTLPGVQPDTATNNGTSGGGGTVPAFSVQGGLPFQTEVSVDGITSQSATSNAPLANAFISGESIAELRVDGVLNNAQFGQPGEVTTISKSGANAVHGGAFWYYQSAAFDAVPFGAAAKPKLVGNNFGGTVGGPVVVPHLYNGRDKSFFFGTYEGFRLPQSTPEQYVVPSTLEKQGNFNYLPANSLQNPFAPGTTYVNNTLPAINPAARQFLGFFPDPNVGNPAAFANGVPNYYTNKSSSQSSDQFDIRGDQYLGQRALVYGRFSWKNYNIENPEPLLVPSSTNATQDRIFALAANYNFSPTLINEFRFGFTLETNGLTNGFNGPAFAAQTGLQGLQNLFYNGVPELDFSSLTPLNADRLTSLTKSRTFQYLDTVSWQIRQHNLKFGLDFRHVEAVTPLGFQGADNYGTFDFSTAQFTGAEFADFLLGLPNSTAYDVVRSDNDGRSLYSNFFAQDEWHARPNLVLSYGVRYEYHPAYTDPSGNIGNFDPSVPGSGRVVFPDDGQATLAPNFLASFNACNVGTSTGVPAANGAPCTPVLSASQAGLPQGLRYVPTHRLLPRFGLAWRPFGGDKTVVSGGFGYYDITLLGGNFYSLTGTLQSDTVNYQNALTAAGPSFAWPAINSAASGAASSGAFGQAYFGTANDIHWKDPYSEQFVLSLERDLGHGTGLRLSYIGLETHQLVWAPNLNDLPYSTTTSAYNQPLSARPFPNWGRINTRSTGGNASYNSAQVEATHRLGAGLQFDSTYTFAKSLADNQGPNQSGFAGETGGQRASYAGDRTVDFGQVYGTRRNRWNSTVLYQLPVGRGRRFGGGMNRLADLAVGGWQTSNIFTWQSGPFLSAYIPAGQADPSGTGSGLNNGAFGDLGHRAQKPDRVGAARPAGQSRDNWINTAAFTCPGNPGWAPGTACHTGAVDQSATDTPAQALASGYLPPIGRFGNAQIGSITGPGTVNLSSGLFKSFAVTERAHLRVEGTFTNVLNHTNLADPSLNITNGDFGRITAARGSDFAGSRTGQVAARLDF